MEATEWLYGIKNGIPKKKKKCEIYFLMTLSSGSLLPGCGRSGKINFPAFTLNVIISLIDDAPFSNRFARLTVQRRTAPS